MEQSAVNGGKLTVRERLGFIAKRAEEAGLRWFQKRRDRSLRLCETLSLGDRRFLAVVIVDQQRFLVGGAANSVCLLARLSGSEPSSEPTHEGC